MFTTGLRYKRLVHFPVGNAQRSTVSSVGHAEGHGVSPTRCTAPLAVAVHQLPSRNSTLGGMKPLPRPSR